MAPATVNVSPDDSTSSAHPRPWAPIDAVEEHVRSFSPHAPWSGRPVYRERQPETTSASTVSEPPASDRAIVPSLPIAGSGRCSANPWA